MKVSIVIRDVVCEVVSCYCPQAGRSVNTKKKQLYEPMDKVVASEKCWWVVNLMAMLVVIWG